MRVGELAAAAGTTAKTLRFYEDAGLLHPADRTSAGYRHYDDEDALVRLNFIRRGRAAGLTLAQIKEVLDIRDAGRAPCRHVEELLDQRLADLDRQIADLVTLRGNVARLRRDAVTADPDTCQAAEICRYL